MGVMGRSASTDEARGGGEGEHTVGLDEAMVGEFDTEVTAVNGGLGTLVVEEVRTRVV